MITNPHASPRLKRNLLALFAAVAAAPHLAAAGQFLAQGDQICYVPDDMRYSNGTYFENAPTHPPGSSEPYGWAPRPAQFSTQQALAAKAQRLGFEEEADIRAALNISHETFVALVKTRQLETVLALAKAGRMSDVAVILSSVAPPTGPIKLPDEAAVRAAPPVHQEAAVPDPTAVEASLAEQAAQQQFYMNNLLSQHARAATVGDSQ